MPDGLSRPAARGTPSYPVDYISHRIVTKFIIADIFVPGTLRVLPAAFRPFLVLTSTPGL
jgi:hypothetical protein